MLVNTIAPLVLFAALCSTQQFATDKFPFSISDDELMNSFDWQLLKEFGPYNKNLLLSPISLKLVLSLLYQGSSSIVEKEFESTLNFRNKDENRRKYSQLLSTLLDNEKSGNLLTIGSSMFVDDNLHVLPKFNRTAWQNFRTIVEPVDFDKPEEASKVINRWVELLTRGKVPKIVSADDLQQTIMLVTNIIYFKGIWKHPFPKINSYRGHFVTVPDNNDRMIMSKYVDYMKTTRNFWYYEDQDLEAKILRLDYKGNSHSMYIILPNSLGGINSLIKKISLTSVLNMKFKLQEELVEVHMPKINFKFSTKFVNILKKLGLKQLFQNTNSLTGIVETNNTIRRQLVVSNIIQKTGIQVDEKGTEAYSVTEIIVGNKMGENKMIFNASHPFLFFIEGPNNTVLFVGKYEDPYEDEGAESGNRWNTNEEADDATSQVYPAPQYNTQRFSNNQGNLPTNRFDVPNQPPQQNPVFDSSISSNMDDSYDPPNAEDIAYRFNLFDVELLSTFSDSKTNVLISPASIKTTLAMILEGAGGKCALEIQEALRIQSLNQRGVRDIVLNLLSNLNEKATTNTYLESRNGIFASNRHKLVDAYRETVIRYYNANVRSLDFSNPEAAANEINQWASDATHGVIKEVVSSQLIEPELRLIFLNTLYFKGKWKTVFQQIPEPKCFQTTPDTCIPTDMMSVTQTFNISYVTSLQAQFVEVPYQEKYSMLVIIPTPETNVKQVLRNLPFYSLDKIIGGLNETKINLEIPKFTLDYSVDLVKYLSRNSIGIKEIFGTNANLSGIIHGNVSVNNLLHKTRMEVDEQGSIAAASTSAAIVPFALPVQIKANRPFAFIIFDRETKNVIFEGIVQNPAKQGSGGSGGRANRPPSVSSGANLVQGASGSPTSGASEAYPPATPSKNEPDYAINTSPSNRQQINLSGMFKNQRLTPVRAAIGSRFAYNYNYESKYFYTYNGAKLVH
ncbi:unnamed protein product [Phyllotreta striolata]|uniref:Serpin domain-containing protein n=1 Tax=Phyllotreta striolata TaxID=444603 RepID=A0A9N9XMZ5_PHYSR|nr:unnamed protein product [Phyllotreta striolata]